MLTEGRKELLDFLKKLHDTVAGFAHEWAEVPMLARTHGQHASPTTVGKEFAVFAVRLQRVMDAIANVQILAKMNGAVGNFNAHIIAYPEKDWEAFSRNVIENRLHLSFDTHTIQIQPHDYMAELFQEITRANTILIDMDRDIWGYISLGYFHQKLKAGEVGSSTMPHKRNPAVCENVLALCRNVRSIAPSIVESMVSEAERDWGCFLSEWEGIPRACHLLGCALAKSKYILENLIVYPEHMEKNLFLQKGLMMSECVMMHLATKLGRLTSHSIVYKACMEAYQKEIPLKDVLMRTPEVEAAFTEDELDHMLNPLTYIGLAPEFVDRVEAEFGEKANS